MLNFLGLVLLCLFSWTAMAGESAVKMVDQSAIDSTVDPCVDFYQYACGSWLKTAAIPADRSSWTRSFSTIDEDALNTLHGLLEGYQAGKYQPKVKYAKKLGDFYASCMNEATISARGKRELQAEFKTIDAIKDHKTLAAKVADLHQKGVDALFGFGAIQDYDDATKMIGEIGRGGLGLPEREYYFSDDPKMKKIQQNYRVYIGKMLGLAGLPVTSADEIFNFEKNLISQGLAPAERRLSKNYIHLRDLKAMLAEQGNFAWNTYFHARKVKLGRINEAEVKTLQHLNDMLATTPLDSLKRYLEWRLISSLAMPLGDGFEQAEFHFESENFTGTKELPPRWKRCTQLISNQLGEALGEAYVAAKFSPEAKKMAKDVTARNLAAMKATITSLPWMDKTTKQAALVKVDRFMMKIGYPDKWRNYDPVVISRQTFLRNSLNATAFENAREMGFIGKPTDRTLWGMPPQMVNAYYNPQENEIVFPAAITQPPFFNLKASAGANFGAYGFVNGHEISHGFDDQGAEYDSVGNHKNWWTSASKAAFEQKTKCLDDQYSHYVAVDDLKVNGALTLGENIADQAGSILAFQAYESTKAGHAPASAMDGFDEDKQFFISLGQVWCTKMTDESARTRAKTNPHSPARWRVNGTLSNNANFARVFACKKGTPMNPKKQCVIW